MKTYKVKNYKGNLVESLKRFQESHKDMKIVEACEEGNELKIKSENVLNERTMNLSKLTFYHGSQVSPKVMKIKPPSPENPFYVTTEKEYAQFYANQPTEEGGEEGGVYIIKLAKSVKIFDPENSGDIKAISKYIPRLVQLMWLGTNIYGVDVDHYETLDLYDVSRTLMPPIDKDQYKNIVKIPKGNKELTNMFNQDLKELYSWCKERGYNTKGDNENFIRTEILKILDKLGYQVYYGTEVETKGLASEIEANIYGIFNIKAIDKISANKIADEPWKVKYKERMNNIGKGVTAFSNDLAKCIGKNLSQMNKSGDERQIKKFINSILKAKFALNSYEKEYSIENYKKQFIELSNNYSPEQLKICLNLLKYKCKQDMGFYLPWKDRDRIKKSIIDPLLNAIDKDGVDKSALSNLRSQSNELLKL